MQEYARRLHLILQQHGDSDPSFSTSDAARTRQHAAKAYCFAWLDAQSDPSHPSDAQNLPPSLVLP